jgi:hypothetical protein
MQSTLASLTSRQYSPSATAQSLIERSRSQAQAIGQKLADADKHYSAAANGHDSVSISAAATRAALSAGIQDASRYSDVADAMAEYTNRAVQQATVQAITSPANPAARLAAALWG